jgi:hypothetical protein
MIQFKTPRIEQEFSDLQTKNPKLVCIINALAALCRYEFRKEITITDIYRSEDEYKALYAYNLSAMPTDRPHSSWLACDLRSSDFTDAEIRKMLTFLNMFTYVSGKPVSFYHAIPGNAYHFHVQSVSPSGT